MMGKPSGPDALFALKSRTAFLISSRETGASSDKKSIRVL